MPGGMVQPGELSTRISGRFPSACDNLDNRRAAAMDRAGPDLIRPSQGKERRPERRQQLSARLTASRTGPAADAGAIRAPEMASMRRCVLSLGSRDVVPPKEI